MTDDHTLGSISGVRLSYQPLAIAGSVIVLLIGIVVFVSIGVAPGAALAGALIAVVLHWVSVVIHDLGHAWAARLTGYPMNGIRMGRLAVLATCVYPAHEPALQARVHIQRALGGPLTSLLVSFIAAGFVLVALSVRDAAPLLWWLSLFFFVDNFAVLTLGAFMPLGFTDGNTLLEWRSKQ